MTHIHPQMINYKLPDTPFKLLLFFLLHRKKSIIGSMFIISLAGLVPSLDSILSKKIIDTVEALSGKDSEYILNILFPWAIIYALWWEMVSWIWRSYDYFYLIKTAPTIKADVVDKFYSYIQHHSAQFFQERMMGDITNRITEAARSVENLLSLFLEKIILKTVIVIASLITMYSVHPIFSAIIAIWMSCFIGINALFSRGSIKYSKIYAREKALLAGKIVDVISNISAVRMFSTHNYEYKLLRKQLNTNVESDQRLQWFMLKSKYVQNLSCTIMMFAMVYYLGVLRAAGQVTLGDFALILMLCIAIADNIWTIGQEVGEILEEYGIFSQSTSLIKPYLITDTEDASLLKISEGKIEFRDVSFNYKKDTSLFSGKNITIFGNQKIGLVGYSGSGKSTFVSLISRLYDVNSGKILIDGQNIKEVSQASLKQNIGFIPQEPILFHRSVKENIAYGTEASDEQIMDAAKKAHIHDVIMALPEKYDTLCGERGNNLSGGQRQRVIIARAILKNAPILILDEATSALDSLTEKYIQESINYLMKGKTVLVIAHRLSTLLDMDRILVFENGKVVEDGTHKELLKTKGLYEKLWNSQIEGFLNDK